MTSPAHAWCRARKGRHQARRNWESWEVSMTTAHRTQGAHMVKNLPATQETWVWSLGGEIPWRREWQPTRALLPGESPDQRSLVSYHLGGHRELDLTEWLTLSLFTFTGLERRDLLREKGRELWRGSLTEYWWMHACKETAWVRGNTHRKGAGETAPKCHGARARSCSHQTE